MASVAPTAPLSRRRPGSAPVVAAAVLAMSLVASLALPGSVAQADAAERTAIHVGQTFLAEMRSPLQGSAPWAWQSHGVAQTLFTVSRDGRVVPQLATGAVPQGDGWQIALRDDIRYSDGSRMTAERVAHSLRMSNTQHALGNASVGRMSISVVDETTLHITSERPTPIMPSVLAEWPFVIFGGEPEDPVFTGPYRIAEFVAGSELRLEPNPHYPEAEARPEIVVLKFSDPQSLALALEAGELDMAFFLPPESVPRLRRNDDLVVKSTQVGYQMMLWLNSRRAPLDETAVRQAVDLAIDRADLITVLNGGTVATGLYPPFFDFSHPEPRPTDPDAAARLLDEAGWERGEDGLRRRDGETLSVTLTAYPQRPETLTVSPVLKSHLDALGFRVETRVAENVSQVAAEGSYDLLLWLQHMAPAGDGAFMLSGFFGADQGYNRWGYRSDALEEILDRLGSASDPEERTRLLHEGQEVVFADAPAVFLITPDWHVGLSSRMADYEPYPTDYYIIREDLRAPGS